MDIWGNSEFVSWPMKMCPMCDGKWSYTTKLYRENGQEAKAEIFFFLRDVLGRFQMFLIYLHEEICIN